MNRSRSNDIVSRRSLTKVNHSNSKSKHRPEIFTSQAYLNKVKEDSGQIILSNFHEQVFQSLKEYEKQIRNLRVASSLQQIQLDHLRQYASYYRIVSYEKENNVGPEPYNPEETNQLKKLSQIDDYTLNRKQTADLILQKVDTEEKEQLQFIDLIKDEFVDQHFVEVETISKFVGFLNTKLTTFVELGMMAIKKGLKPEIQKADDLRKNSKIRKNMLYSVIMILNYKVNEEIQWSFRKIIRCSYMRQNQSLENSRAIIDGGMFSSINIKDAFYRWFIKSTEDGEELISHASNNLVLYTNINKVSAFYRLLAAVRIKKKKVHPRVKRMAIMLYLYLEKIISGVQRDAFKTLSQNSKKKKISTSAIEKIVLNSHTKKIQAFLLWKKKIEKSKQKQQLRQTNKKEIARKMIKAAELRMKSATRKWKQVNQKQRTSVCCLVNRLFCRILLARLHELSKSQERKISLFRN